MEAILIDIQNGEYLLPSQMTPERSSAHGASM
jgi:hypothetical protein